MQLNSTKCCALQEIDKLGIYNNAKDALLAFCEAAIPKPPKFWDGSVGRAGELSSFYFFTGAVTHDGTKAGGIHTGGREYLYAKEFMKLIQKEGLGEVWESPIRVNHVFHPGNSNQVYVWMPDNNRLKAWYEKNKPAQPIVLDRPLKV